MRLALVLLLVSAPAWPADPEVPFESPSRAYTCLLLPGWTAFEQATPEGLVDHLVGPEAPAGWRPAYHVHVLEKGKPGWREPRELLKALRRSDDASQRAATALSSWRVSKKSSRLFEASERRLLPAGRLPAEAAGLHHFYAYVPMGGEDYLIVKLTTREDDYLSYRREFYRFLDGLRVTGP